MPSLDAKISDNLIIIYLQRNGSWLMKIQAQQVTLLLNPYAAAG